MFGNPNEFEERMRALDEQSLRIQENEFGNLSSKKGCGQEVAKKASLTSNDDSRFIYIEY